MASFPGQPEYARTRKTYKPSWILMKQEMMGRQWRQLDHVHVICTLLQTDNNASTSSLNFFTGWMIFLMTNQQCQSTEGNVVILATEQRSDSAYTNCH